MIHHAGMSHSTASQALGRYTVHLIGKSETQRANHKMPFMQALDWAAHHLPVAPPVVHWTRLTER